MISTLIVGFSSVTADNHLEKEAAPRPAAEREPSCLSFDRITAAFTLLHQTLPNAGHSVLEYLIRNEHLLRISRQ